MAKISSSYPNDPADVAQRAMPGWHAVMLTDQQPAPVTDALPGRTITQLRAKFLGTRLRSAQHDLYADKAGAAIAPTHLVKMVRDNAGKGPKEMVVIVSGEKVVAVQG
jgi:hypothetical protein